MYVLKILAANILAVWIADNFINGFNAHGGLKGIALAGIILGILFLIVKPVLKLISLPLVWITLGLFTLVIYAILIWAVAYFTPYISVALLMPLVWSTLAIAVINYIARGFKL